MSSPDRPIVTITVPSDARYFRSVRLAVGGLATMAGFDIEAIEDLRIGVDELCAAASEAGDGSELRFDICAESGPAIRIDATTSMGTDDLDHERFSFSRQILSVVSDDFGFVTDGPRVRCWLERGQTVSPSTVGSP